jgi:hypothetical protein
MNAVDFIKKHGVDKAREVVEGAPEGSTKFCITGIDGVPTYLKLVDGDYWFSWMNGFSKACQIAYKRIDELDSIIDIPDIQRLVESVDLVNSFGGLEDAKAVVKMGKHYKYLEKAIADYESIYGG